VGHTGDVSKRERGQSFSEIVAGVRERPSQPEPRTGGVADPTGTYWRRSKAEISPSHALDLASAGTAVAWDACGCGGDCGFTWFTPDEVAHLVQSGPPVVRHKKGRLANISEWSSEDGRRLVVAESEVRWGDLLA